MENKVLLEKLGVRIRKLRKKLKLNIADVTNKSGLSSAYISDIEKGKRPQMSVAALIDLAHALDVSVSELLLGIEDASVQDEEYTNELYYNKVEKTCYPPQLEHYEISTLLQFLLYLPLIRPQDLFESLQRIEGNFENKESYVLDQINQCISQIPASPAKKYADEYLEMLKCDTHYRRKSEGLNYMEKPSAYHKEYMEQVRQATKLMKSVKDIQNNLVYVPISQKGKQ